MAESNSHDESIEQEFFITKSNNQCPDVTMQCHKKEVIQNIAKRFVITLHWSPSVTDTIGD